jgi:regulator of sigma E protease
MDILIRASQFLLSLSLLIILHELGHFIPAKLFKTRVEKFYLFFDPWFSLFKKKVGDTVYGIGWLPLGGYVKIAGMVDESMDTEQLKGEPQPWEFRSKPAWQRLIIMVGGVTVNILLAIAIYAGMLMHYGEQYLPNSNVTYGIMTNEVGHSLGLQNGDRIVAVNGKLIENFSDIALEIVLAGAGEILVVRGGEEVRIPLDETRIQEIIKAKSNFVSLRFPYVAGDFADSSAAARAGMQPGDVITAFNGQTMRFFDQYLDSIPTYAGKAIHLTVDRGGEAITLNMEVPSTGKIGVYPKDPTSFFEFRTKQYGFFEAFPAGIAKAGRMLGDYIRQFKLILNPDTGAYKEVGGFLMIAQQFDAQWDWQRFWSFTAFLSIMLAFLNILPIPALDGGHVVFLLWEMVTGKQAPQKILEYAQMVGFILLLSLIVLANGNDILKLFNP